MRSGEEMLWRGLQELSLQIICRPHVTSELKLYVWIPDSDVIAHLLEHHTIEF